MNAIIYVYYFLIKIKAQCIRKYYTVHYKGLYYKITNFTRIHTADDGVNLIKGMPIRIIREL